MKRFTASAIFLGVLSLIGGEALAHGGGHQKPYSGPAGSVPPIVRPVPTPNPNPNPQPGTTPGPGATPTPTPTPAPTPSPSPNGASPMPASAAAARGGAGGMSRPRGRTTGGPGFESWEFWWAFNKEYFLELKKNLFRAQEVSESSSMFFGRGAKKLFRTDASRPSRKVIREHIIPKLRDALRASNADLRDSACIALGKTGNVAEVDALVEMLKDSTVSVRKAAAIGLGMLQVKQSIRPLIQLLEGAEEGRKLRGGRPPEDVLRAYAAAGLGLIGDNLNHEVRDALMEFAQRAHLNRNIRVHAVLSLGLLRGNGQYVAVIAEHLEKLAGDLRTDTFVRAHAVTALARLLDRNQVPVDPERIRFLVRLVKRDKRNHVKRSAIIALGILAPDPEANPDVPALLVKNLLKPRSVATGNLAAIALGQIGGKQALQALRRVVLRGRSQTTAYAALGLGILCRNLRENRARADWRLKGLSSLRAGLTKVRNPHFKGGLAIALGIAQDRDAGALLLEAMKKDRDVTLRGYLAIALGMVRYQPSMAYLFDVLDHGTNLPLLREQTAIGLGLMGNRQVAARLVRSFEAGSTVYLQASAAQALGFIGDRNSVRPLVDLLADAKKPNLTRAFACVALGTIGEDAQIPVLAEVIVNLNFLASTRSIYELKDIM
jgi:HEAT repeat protein